MGVGWDDGRRYRATDVRHSEDMQSEAGIRHFMGIFYDNPFKRLEVVSAHGCHCMYPRMVVCMACGI